MRGIIYIYIYFKIRPDEKRRIKTNLLVCISPLARRDGMRKQEKNRATGSSGFQNHILSILFV